MLPCLDTITNPKVPIFYLQNRLINDMHALTLHLTGNTSQTNRNVKKKSAIPSTENIRSPKVSKIDRMINPTLISRLPDL